MSIKFPCPHCTKALSVKDELAGKKGPCPFCKKPVTVPTKSPPAQVAPPEAVAPARQVQEKPVPAPKKPAPAPSPQIQERPAPAPVDLEAEAAAALVDEPAGAAVDTTTIDFTCPNCDAELHLPLDLASKRAPCPECKRIIKVPEPAKKDPKNWRKTEDHLPSGARRADQPAPEGAWGTAGATTTVSREALAEAGALPAKKQRVTVGQWVVRGLIAASAVALLVFGSLYVWNWWTLSREDQAIKVAVDYADSDEGKNQLGGEGRAAVYLLVGKYAQRANRFQGANGTLAQYEKALGAAGPAGTRETTAHAVVLQDLALAECDVGGDPKQVEEGSRPKWDEVQKTLRDTLAAIQAQDARVEALRGATRRLVDKGQGDRALAVTSMLYPKADADKADAIGAVGLELLAAKQPKLAERAADQALQLYAAEKDRPVLAASAVALATALAKPLLKPRPKEEKGFKEDKGDDEAKERIDQVENLARRGLWDEARAKIKKEASLTVQGRMTAAVAAVADDVNDRIGRAEGLARLGQWPEARALIKEKSPPLEVRLRIYAGLAAAALNDKTAGSADAAAGLKLMQDEATGLASVSPWVLQRLVRLGAAAGLPQADLMAAAAVIPDAEVRGRAQLGVVEAQLLQSKQRAEMSVIEPVDAQSLAYRLARADLARHNYRYDSGTAAAVKGWPPPLHAFGSAGVALGMQGDE